MLHRIFIAINLPDIIKNELARWQEKWFQLPCRWVNKENLHITLVFIGNVSDKELLGLKMKVGEIAKKHKKFSLKFTNIVYGPAFVPPCGTSAGKPASIPKMIWAIGPESKELLMLQKDLAKTLLGDSVPKGEGESQQFALHLTLGRLKEFEFKRIEPEERPEVNEEINIEIPVTSIEIMESRLKRVGAEYTICESILLA